MDSGEVSEIGDAPFSSYGKISYAEKQNRIVSTYGTENICYQVVSRISGCKSSAVGAVMKDASGYRDAAEAIRKASGKSGDNVSATPEAENAITVHTYYYAGFPLPDGADGTSKDNYLLTNAADTTASGEDTGAGTSTDTAQAAAGQNVAAGQTDAVQAAGTEQAEAGAAGSEPAAAAPSAGTEDKKSEKSETIEPPGDTFLVDENVYNQSLSDMVNGNKLTEISYDQMQDLSSLKLK
jgi:cytoskeletal protein RodZ